MTNSHKKLKCANENCKKFGACHISSDNFKRRAHRNCESAPCDCQLCGPIKIKAPAQTMTQRWETWKQKKIQKIGIDAFNSKINERVKKHRKRLITIGKAKREK